MFEDPVGPVVLVHAGVAVPVMFQVPVPDGVPAPVGPVTVAVNTAGFELDVGLGRTVVGAKATATVGVALPTVVPDGAAVAATEL